MSRAKLEGMVMKMVGEVKRLQRDKKNLERYVTGFLGLALKKLDPKLRAKTLAKSKIVANKASNTKATVLGRLSKLRGTKGSLELPDAVINVPPPLPAAAVTTAVGTDDVGTGSA